MKSHAPVVPLSEAELEPELREKLEFIQKVRVRELRKVSTRVLKAVSLERAPSQRDLQTAMTFCQAMRLVPRYSRGVALESIFLQLQTVLTDAIYFYLEEEARVKDTR